MVDVRRLFNSLSHSKVLFIGDVCIQVILGHCCYTSVLVSRSQGRMNASERVIEEGMDLN